ncbi:MAG: hypothetical protein FRX49_02248 [Trebouxia sp. A1-2]|nr:MAG: hypothetical protein FRX49_02248 [Trebouxia sp. A1-2]
MARLYQESVLTVNADSTEFCPLQDLHNLLAVGTYQLDEKTQIRHGLLHLYAMGSKWPGEVHLADETTDRTHHWQLQQMSALPISGIFDMKWQVAHPARLLAACADGSVHMLALQLSGDTSWLVEQQKVVVTDNAMALSMDIATCGQRIVASSSAGTLSALQASESQTCVTAQWQAHDLEAWSAAFDRWQDSVVYSGADDCMFKGWDLRQPESSPTFVNRKSHSAGVCCIASSIQQEHCLVTGSYDEHIRLWDTRRITQPVEIAQVSTGGGVWRLKWHPRCSTQILAACMHNGFAVISADHSTGDVKVLEEYSGQKSLGYGADWCHLPTDGYSIAATCSFYDRLLHLWSPAAPCTASR